MYGIEEGEVDIFFLEEEDVVRRDVEVFKFGGDEIKY